MMKITLSTLLLLISGTLFSQDGSLDDLFGTGGIVLSSPGPDDDFGRSVLILPDGKILISGYLNIQDQLDFFMIRYQPDGSPDKDFGDNGVITHDFFGGTDFAYSSVLQPDGKIILAGEVWYDQSFHIGLVRFDKDGKPDSEFGTDGEVVIPVGENSAAWSVTLDQDGYIILGGQTQIRDFKDFVLVKLKTTGELDESFGDQGILVVDFRGGDDVGFSVATDHDRNIFLGGYAWNDRDYDFAVLKTNSRGLPDSDFGSDGQVVLPVGEGDDFCRALAIQQDGSVLLGGNALNNEKFEMTVVRLGRNGTPDELFGNNGMAAVSINGESDYGYDLEIQQDEKIILSGFTRNKGKWELGIIRLETDGALDLKFNETGKQSIAPSGDTSLSFSVAVQPDGQIVMAGHSIVNENNEVAVVRLNGSSGPLPVELTSLSGFLNGNQINLTWSTKSETTNFGWEVQVQQKKSGIPYSGNSGAGIGISEWKTIGFVPGQGTSRETHQYQFNSPWIGTEAIVRLSQIDMDGTVTLSKILTLHISDEQVVLHPNFPNPFNPETTIQFSLPRTGWVNLSVYDLSGKLISNPVNDIKPAGFHEIRFSGDHLSSGIYWYRLKTEAGIKTGRMTLLK